MRASRRGFVLIFVLWVVVSASALAMALAGIGRGELDMIRQRMSGLRAQWAASGCLDRFRAHVEEQLWSDGYTASSVDVGWMAVDGLALSLAGCRLQIRPSGLAIDVNTATPDRLRRLFLKLGMSGGRADSLADAIIDWRDTDDQARGGGSEATWYRDHGRIPPRNERFADVAELALVRGVEAELLGRGVLGVNPERILWRQADPAVLATLPGMTDEALAVLSSRGAAQLSDLTLLVDFPELPVAARDSLARASHVLIPMITSRVESWTVTAFPIAREPSYVRATDRLGLRDRYLAVLERRFLP